MFPCSGANDMNVGNVKQREREEVDSRKMLDSSEKILTSEEICLDPLWLLQHWWN